MNLLVLAQETVPVTDLKDYGIWGLLIVGIAALFGPKAKELVEKLFAAFKTKTFVVPTVEETAYDLDPVLLHVGELLKTGQERKDQAMIDDALKYLSRYYAIPKSEAVATK